MSDLRTDAFNPQTLTADINAVAGIFERFFAGLSQADWRGRTERGKGGWTLLETVAHLDAVAQVYHQATLAGLAKRPLIVAKVTRRTDLPAWMEAEIEVRRRLAPAVICTSFLATLHRAAELASRLTTAELAQSILFPGYEARMSVAELLGGQAVHPGLVHAAQVANAAGVQPLWRGCAPELVHRQITRLFHLMALSYWPERGGKLQATINFVVAGPGGGAWHVTVAPEGGGTGLGRAKQPTLTLWFRTTDAFSEVITLQIHPILAVLTGRSFAWGNVPLGLRLLHLFSPT